MPAALSGDISWEDWRRVLSVNLDGAFLIAAAAFRLMRDQKPQGGRIINNGSISAYAPRYGSLPYTASKHAITGLTKSLSLDGRAFDIACGQIDIGNAASDMTARMTGGVPQADGRLAPEPRIDVEHVARAVVQMAELPLDVNVQFITIMATKMPFIGRRVTAARFRRTGVSSGSPAKCAARFRTTRSPMAARVLRGRRALVRREDDVGQGEERLRHPRLVGEDVERGAAEAARDEELDQGGLVDQRAAGDVDEAPSGPSASSTWRETMPRVAAEPGAITTSQSTSRAMATRSG